MEKNIIEIKSITELFLNQFEIEWNFAMEEINCKQGQLRLGNRLRPQMAFWGYMAALPDNSAINWGLVSKSSVSIELIHKASLLIDDWIDGDEARHGIKSFHTEYSPYYAVAMAIHMVSYSIHRLKNISTIKRTCSNQEYICMDLIVKTVYEMSKGLLEELNLSQVQLLNYEKIEEIEKLQTSEILGNSILLGYYIGGGTNQNVCQILKLIGNQCGFLFQTLNDLEAYSNVLGNIKHKGKENYDFDKNRKNIVICKLYNIASTNDKHKIKKNDITEICSLICKYKVIDAIIEEMNIVYQDIIFRINSLSDFGLSSKWINGFSQFMLSLKETAEKRLNI